MTMRIAVAQLGARMHYAVPKILQRAGRLEHFYTDLYAGPLARLVRPLTALPGGTGLKRFLGRTAEGVPQEKVTAFFGLGIGYALRRSRARTDESQAEVYLRTGRSFCRKLIRQGLGDATHTFTFNSAGLEWMRHARASGLKTVMEQTIAPKAYELRLLLAEQARFPGWEPPQAAALGGALLDYCQREQAEWETADLILCGSQFVKDSIQACQGPVERCVVVPYGVDGRPAAPRRRGDGDGPLRVLTVGAAGLRKGSPTVLETAKLAGPRCEFRMVGPLHISAEAQAKLAGHADVRGPVPRSSIQDHYAWADVFFLPSVCEGSATVVYEALAAGLPVLTTPNAGSVVTHGEDGWLAPVGAAQEMAERLLWARDNLDALADCSVRALEKARHYDTSSYGQRLLGSLEQA